jgi:predicted transposase YbfD/YdcC
MGKSYDDSQRSRLFRIRAPWTMATWTNLLDWVLAVVFIEDFRTGRGCRLLQIYAVIGEL